MLSTKERLCLERQKRRLRLLKITICFLCFVCIVVGSYQLVHQPWFSFGNIDIVGARNVKNEDVIRTLNLQGPVNLFLIDRNRVKNALEKDFRIEKVDTSYVWPNILKIEVTERQPAIYVKCAYGGFAQVDFNGCVLSVSKGIKDASVPFVSGISVGNAYLGDKVQKNDVGKIVVFLSRLDKSLLSRISEIAVDGQNKVKIIMLSGVQILVGDVDGLEEKVVTFITICNEIQSKNIDGYYIDLTFAKPYIKVKQ
ncbi:MAG: cell division protein FtsQ/DivIB [Acidaminococcaceae bacterium]